MNIKMIGIDHTMAPLDLRQNFSFTKKGATEAMLRLKQQPQVSGCIILSTCNRMELWLSCEEAFNGSAYEILCSIKGVAREAYRKYFKCRENKAAVEHLYLLASGMASQIMGEDQILTQVKEAAALARENYCTDQVLEVLFRMAVTAGKKVKTCVPMAKANYSAAHQALASLRQEGFSVAGKTCMVIGNGEMGRLTALALQEAKAEVLVTVRQYRSGVVNIPEGCSRIHYGERYACIPSCDMVFSATASPNFTITRMELEKLTLPRQQIYVDLAVPRDIEPAIKVLPGIRLYDIDSFHIDARSGEMKQQYQKASDILAEKTAEFFDWYSCRDLIPRVQKISGQAADDVTWRTKKTVKELALYDSDKQALYQNIETAAQKVVGKLIYELRDSLSQEAFRECLDALEHIYQENT